MKPKSPLAGDKPSNFNTLNYSRQDSSRLINPPDYAMDNVRHELETKIRDLKIMLLNIYKDIKESSIDEICKTYGKNPLTYLETEKKPDLDELGRGLKLLIEKMLKYFRNVSEPVKRMEERFVFDTNERLEFLEKELKSYKMENDKAKLLIETAYIRIDDLEKKRQELMSENKRLKQKFGSEIEKVTNKLTIKTDMLKYTQEDNILNNSRPTTSKQLTKDFFSPRTESTMDQLKMTSARMSQTKMINTEKTKNLHDFRRRTAQENDNELKQRQKDTLIARLKVQVEERDRDLAIMKKELDRVYSDLKQMKDIEFQREKKEWAAEILSDKNPNMVKHYEDLYEGQKVENSQLKKQLRKFAINDKKVNIKEKAFEYERAEYQDKLKYLQERVNRLLRLNDELINKNDRQKDILIKPVTDIKKDDIVNRSIESETVQESRYEGHSNMNSTSKVGKGVHFLGEVSKKTVSSGFKKN